MINLKQRVGSLIIFVVLVFGAFKIPDDLGRLVALVVLTYLLEKVDRKLAEDGRIW